MKTFVKILVAIIVVAAICGGVYLVLPETAQIFVKGNIQYRTNDEAKDKIDSLKKNEIVYTDVQSNGTEKKVPTGVTYGDALDKKAKTTDGIMRTQQTVDSESHIMEQRSAWILQSMVQMEHI